MATSAAGIIFSNLHDGNIPELTRVRTMSSVPFGCRYRFIDFALSNMVNSGITNVNVVTHNSYQSLMDHVGSGKDWDLARRSGGLKILPPYVSAASKNVGLYTTRLEALRSIVDVIGKIKEDLIVMTDCDILCNIDLRDVINQHVTSGAKMTVVVTKMLLTPENAPHETEIVSDGNGFVREFLASPVDTGKVVDVTTNIVVADKDFLYSAVRDAQARGYTSISKQLVPQYAPKKWIKIYSYDGYYSDVTSMAEYFRHSMSILDKNNRDALFGIKERPILTKVRNSAPTKYIDGCKVSNSLIADGCIIEGTVENSLLFRGVKVAKGAVVRNSILFQDTRVAEGAFLNCVISDKEAQITEDVMLSGHSSMPFYIEKGRKI